MPTLTKGVTGVLELIVKNTKAPGDGNGSFEAVISSEALDRDGEILDKGAFEPLPAEIPIHADHRVFDVEAIVGRGAPSYDGDQLVVKGDYAGTPTAQLVRQLVGEGMLKTMSVSYRDALYEDEDGVPHLRSAELLEASFVSVPANREALVTASKALGEKVGARNAAKDAERLQSIHDLAVENGATCVTDDEGEDDAKTVASLAAAVAGSKSIAGSFEDLRDRLSDALREATPDAAYVWVRATFEDRVVYQVETENAEGGYDVATLERPYTDGDDGFDFGDPTEIDVEEVVTPAKTASTPGPGPAADAAPKAASDAGSALAVTRAAAASAEAALLLTE